MATEQLQQDLQYVANAVRRNERDTGEPAIYYLWAAIIAVGWSLPDFAPTLAAPYWIVFGIGGGLASWWYAARSARRRGTRDAALGRRWGWHWLIGGVGFAICWLPLVHGAPIQAIVGNFMLVAGLVYLFAGLHLERGLLGSGALILLGYVVLSLFPVRGVWTAAGILVALALVWAGVAAQRRRRIPAE